MNEKCDLLNTVTRKLSTAIDRGRTYDPLVVVIGPVLARFDSYWEILFFVFGVCV